MNTKTTPNPNSPAAPDPQPRSRSKIARLPHDLRELLNTLLRDGVTYDAIIKKLAEQGVKLFRCNISRWHKKGYQEWLKQQLWLQDMGGRLHFVTDLVRRNESEHLPEVARQLASLRLFEILKHLDPTP